MGLTQNMIDHETLFNMACKSVLCRFFIHSNFHGSLGPQALVLGGVGWYPPLPPMREF